MLKHIAIVISSLLVLVLDSTAIAQPSCQRCGNWGINELYSNADGSVQFFMLQNAVGIFWPYTSVPLTGLTLIANDSVTERSLTFDAEPRNVATKPILVATQGFVDLNLIKPDFIIPTGFLPLRRGTLRLDGSSWWDRDVLQYVALPTDGATARYMDVDGDYTKIAQAINNAGDSYTFFANAPNSFRMTAIFSDQAGLYQYIQFQEQSGLDNQHHFIGLTLTAKSRGGLTRTISFDDDLPDSNTAGRPVLMGTTHVGLPEVDFMLPPGFLPTDGGTLVFAGVDAWSYESLPANGYTVLLRDGSLTTNRSFITGMVFRPFTGFPTGLLALVDPVIEYYNKSLDHYFITSSQPDIAALDSNWIFGWRRTGETFPAWIAPLFSFTSSPPGMGPVCRIYVPFAGGSSHFFSASPAECAATLSEHPNAVLETAKAFYASLPDPQTGECLYDQQPVYRLWNGRADLNHRFTTSASIRDQMLSRGYVAEGYGMPPVAMCVGGGIFDD